MHIGLKIKQLMLEKKLNAPSLAKTIGKTKQSIYGYMEKQDIDTSILRDIANALEVPMTYFFESESNNSGSSIIGDHKDSTTISSTGSNININTGNSKTKKEEDKKDESHEKLTLFYWSILENLVNNFTGLMPKIVLETPQIQPFIAKQNEMRVIISQLNTLLKLSDNMILHDETFFDYFENPY